MDFNHQFNIGCATIGTAIAAAYCLLLLSSPFMVVAAPIAMFGGICALTYGIEFAAHQIHSAPNAVDSRIEKEDSYSDLSVELNEDELQKIPLGNDRNQNIENSDTNQ